MTLNRRNWSVFSWPIDQDRRFLCIVRCQHELARARHYSETVSNNWEMSDSYYAAIKLVQRRVWLAKALPFLNHSFLGLDRCWLMLLGFRFAQENKWRAGGIDTTLTIAEQVLKLPFGSLKDCSVGDVFRLYYETKLVETWKADPSEHLKAVA